jgi:hypothetical protein
VEACQVTRAGLDSVVRAAEQTGVMRQTVSAGLGTSSGLWVWGAVPPLFAGLSLGRSAPCVITDTVVSSWLASGSIACSWTLTHVPEQQQE